MDGSEGGKEPEYLYLCLVYVCVTSRECRYNLNPRPPSLSFLLFCKVAHKPSTPSLH